MPWAEPCLFAVITAQLYESRRGSPLHGKGHGSKIGAVPCRDSGHGTENDRFMYPWPWPRHCPRYGHGRTSVLFNTLCAVFIIVPDATVPSSWNASAAPLASARTTDFHASMPRLRKSTRCASTLSLDRVPKRKRLSV